MNIKLALKEIFKKIWMFMKGLPSFLKKEFGKTFVILKHMLQASKTNVSMKETYVELGKMTFQALKKNPLLVHQEDPRLALMKRIEHYHTELDQLDHKVNILKTKRRSF
jgi:hypothetical protein